MTKPRPIQPTTVRQIVQFLALLDPRCAGEPHTRIVQGESCARCGLSLASYTNAMEWVWPDA